MVIKIVKMALLYSTCISMHFVIGFCLFLLGWMVGWFYGTKTLVGLFNAEIYRFLLTIIKFSLA